MTSYFQLMQLNKLPLLLLMALNSLVLLAQPAVIPGDYPDPSIIKVGDAYWASATTSNWSPAYPLLTSNDLVTWKTVSSVFTKLPSWADYYFWAPELTQDNGKIYVYYTAHKKGGNLCVAVASADQPEGPYRDHGPLVCQEVGSIDAFPMRDENGKLYLIWKEDGNSVKKPTPIWAQPMNEERTALTGEKQEIFRDDTPWENHLVEGVSMLKHGGYFYAFYAGAGCCGAGCSYATGVARAKSLLGPWEKYSKNPVLTANEDWRCPGHGTAIEKDGKFYFFYHAYSKESSVYTGRQALMNEFVFTDDGWINFRARTPIATNIKPVPVTVTDSFTENTLSKQWGWSVFQQPKVVVKNGEIAMKANKTPLGTAIVQRTLSGDYTVTTTVDLKRSKAQPGLAVIGDDDNALGVSTDGKTIQVWKLERKKRTILATKPLDNKQSVTLKMMAKNGHLFTFAYATDGQTYESLNKQPVDGAYLPPWDRAVRVGLTAQGRSRQKAVFDDFILRNTLP